MPPLTPARRRFLEAAVAAGGEIRRDGVGWTGRATRFHAGGQSLLETSGRTLERAGLIERVLIPGTQSTEPIRVGRMTTAYRYRLTPAGRAAVATTED